MLLARRPSFIAAVSLILFAVFVWMRVRELNVRVMHNDEGVNAWFLTRLVRDNDYKYDPYNYHGPSLYYLELLPIWATTLIKDGPLDFRFSSLDGVTDNSVRSGVVAASLILLAGFFACQSRIGKVGAFTAFAVLGFSTDFLYYSRYLIHEMFFVLFTLGIYVGALRYRDQRRRSDYALMFLSLVMLFCTKETSIVTMTVMGLAGLCAEITHSFLNKEDSVPILQSLQKDVQWFLGDLFTQHLVILAVGILLWFCLYTSFKPFQNFDGLANSIRTYSKWMSEGVESGHNKPFMYWIKDVLIPSEGPLSVLAIVGIVVAFVKRERPGLFLAFWAMGITAAYSLIPYKTVWCVLNLLLPMALVGGYGIQRLFDMAADHWRMRSPALSAGAVLIILGIALLQVPQAWSVTYVNYDKEYYEQPYVHTSRDIFFLMDRIRELSQQIQVDRDIQVNVVSSLYWPLPYYLRFYPNANFWGRLLEKDSMDAQLLIAERKNLEVLKEKLKDPYRIEEYTLRPDFPLYLFINEKYFGKTPVLPLPASPLPPISSANAEHSGLVRKLFIDRRPIGTPLEQSVDFSDLQYEWKTENDKPIKSPFSYTWDGFISVPSDGPYTFGIDSDDGSTLSIDGYTVIDNSGTHAERLVRGSIPLKKGLHRFSAFYFDGGGQAIFKAFWRLPGHTKETTIPGSVFFHEEKQ